MEKNWDCLDCQACTVCGHTDSECGIYREYYGYEIPQSVVDEFAKIVEAA